jgi:thymidylate synthase
MTLPPCHYSFQVYTRELRTPERMDWLNKMNNSDQRYRNVTMDELNVPTRAISLMWNQRSCDFPLGIPFNIASYGLLLEIIGKMVNMVPEELIGNLGDCHIYLNQIEGCKEQIGRELRIDERICMCYENPSLDLTKIHEDMSDDEFKIVCDVFNIPTRTREPFELPSLKIEKTDTFFQSLGCDLSLLTHLDISDFKLEGYQSHPIIKFPLSN